MTQPKLTTAQVKLLRKIKSGQTILKNSYSGLFWINTESVNTNTANALIRNGYIQFYKKVRSDIYYKLTPLGETIEL